MARQEGLVESRSGSVKPSPATLVRVAFDYSRPLSCQTSLARQEGLEPPTYCLEGSCSIQLSYWRISMERVTGIGPAYPAWKAGVLPLNYTRTCPYGFSYQILAQLFRNVKVYLEIFPQFLLWLNFWLFCPKATPENPVFCSKTLDFCPPGEYNIFGMVYAAPVFPLVRVS